MGEKQKTSVIFFSPVPQFKGGAEKCLFDFIANPSIIAILCAPQRRANIGERQAAKPCDFTVPFGDVENIHRPFSFFKGIKVTASLFRAGAELKRKSKEYKAFIVHSNGLKAHAINCVSRFMGGPKAVIHIHDIPLSVQEKAVWHILYYLCDTMILVSRPCWPRKKLPSKCRVIHNGIEPTLLPNDKETGVLNHKMVIGFVGRIHPAKGLHLLLSWIAEGKIAGYDIELSVRGSFSEDAPDYEAKIRKLISEKKLDSAVSFMGHISDPENVYRGLDLVVVPSETPDPLPRSVMEPMALGIPVFGYPAGGIIEMIDDGKTGFLVNDDRTFLNALGKLSECREEIISGARQKIKNEFSLAGLYDSLYDVYNSI